MTDKLSIIYSLVRKGELTLEEFKVLMEKSPTQIKFVENIINNILRGIDQTETESESGWWETSSGAAFGKRKLYELIHDIKQFIELQ